MSSSSSSSCGFTPHFELALTPLDAIEPAVARVRAHHATGALAAVSDRKEALGRLLEVVKRRAADIEAACAADLGKPAFEARVTEVNFLTTEIVETIENVDMWAAPQRVRGKGAMALEHMVVERQALGVVCVIGAWNYPFQLVAGPVCGAIAAGNCVVVKPSEISPASAELMREILSEALPDVCTVVQGGPVETAALLRCRFDHIFYTGGAGVGRKVMAAAAEHLTPVTLELGGKSPCVVDENVDTDIAARRIMWGRLVNCGQTCIAPDYILVKESCKKPLIDALRQAREEFLGSDPQKSLDYGRIVNARHYGRVTALMKGGTVVVGGETDEATRFIAPTVLDDVDLKSPLMTEEIFGPLLPVISWKEESEVIDFINKREKPLAMYVFSTNKRFYNNIIAKTSSGGVCVNDTLMHVGSDALPFGGVGQSGMGNYHGRHSFETFSHKRSVMRRPLAAEVLNAIRYPPYTDTKLKLLTTFVARTKVTPAPLRLARKVMFMGTCLFVLQRLRSGINQTSAALAEEKKMRDARLAPKLNL